MGLGYKQTGILLVTIGAICFSAKAIFIKIVYKDYAIDDLSLLALRFGFSLPFFLCIAAYRYYKGNFKAVQKADIFQIFLLSFLGYYIASWLDFKGLKFISAGIERVILFIYPTFVVIFSRIFLKKPFKKKTILSLLLTYFGIILIAIEPRIFVSDNFYLGAGFILISAFTYAIYLTFGGQLIEKYGSINFNSLAMVFSSIYVLIHFAFSSRSIFDIPSAVLPYGFLLAIVSTVIPTFMVMEGVKRIGANQAAIVGSIGPVSTILLGYVFLGETFSIQELLGSSLVLAGVLLLGK